MTDTAERVKKLLLAGGATAAQVAESLGVSKPTAYKYIRALRKAHGAVITARRERVSARGPRSKVYCMAKDWRTR